MMRVHQETCRTWKPHLTHATWNYHYCDGGRHRSCRSTKKRHCLAMSECDEVMAKLYQEEQKSSSAFREGGRGGDILRRGNTCVKTQIPERQ